MPKSTEKFLDSAPAEFLYSDVASMPWTDIEAKTRKEFSEEDRKEIFSCTVIYAQGRSFVRDAAPVSEFEALQKSMLKHAEALSAIRMRYRPTTTHHSSESDETVFLALAQSLDEKCEGLTTLLGAAANACDALIDALVNANLDDLERTSRDGNVNGLAHFIADALKRATKTPARSNRGYEKNPTAFEYQRWGLHLSPKAGDLPVFASAVLGRSVSQNQIQHAFRVAHDHELIDGQE